MALSEYSLARCLLPDNASESTFAAKYIATIPVGTQQNSVESIASTMWLEIFSREREIFGGEIFEVECLLEDLLCPEDEEDFEDDLDREDDEWLLPECSRDTPIMSRPCLFWISFGSSRVLSLLRSEPLSREDERLRSDDEPELRRREDSPGLFSSDERWECELWRRLEEWRLPSSDLLSSIGMLR